MLVEFGKANLLDKARQQPDKVRMVLDKVKTDGLMPTLDAVRSKLDQPLRMGYCNAGVVLEVGAGVTGFSVDDRVASNGKHAEVVCVPKNLCVKVPEAVSDEAAAECLLEAFEEMLTLHWLKVPALLRKTLMSTNPIESMLSLAHHCEHNCRRTHGIAMLQRWLGSVLFYCEGQFKKMKGYAGLAQVVATIGVQQSEPPAPMTARSFPLEVAP